MAAPTCGDSGVIPAVLEYSRKVYKSDKTAIVLALATAGLIGNLIKRNASISGAEVGCQGEVGTACAMASGAATQLMGGTIYQIEYSAEMGLEHHLGLTCDMDSGWPGSSGKTGKTIWFHGTQFEPSYSNSSPGRNSMHQRVNRFLFKSINDFIFKNL